MGFRSELEVRIVHFSVRMTLGNKYFYWNILDIQWFQVHYKMIWYYDTIFVVGALSFTFPSVVKEGFFTPHPHQHLSVTFLMIANVTGLRWYLTLALISTALIINNAKHLFMCLKAICMSSLKNFLFRSSAVSKIGLVDFLI